MSAKKAAGLAKRTFQGGRRIALFGGTFDPIHLGHLAVAEAAAKQLRLHRVYFIPSAHPPHKPLAELACYEHRYAMVTLACAGNPRFVPSLAEKDDGTATTFYSIDTVRRFRREKERPEDRLYFIVGADSFLQIATWKDYKTLLSSCDFVVASRPGFRTEALREAIPSDLLASPPSMQTAATVPKVISLIESKVHILGNVSSNVSATQVRERLDHGRSVRGLVPAGVEEYITKLALYRPR